MARIVQHLSLEDPQASVRSAADATQARHVQAIWLLAQGHSVCDVADWLAFVPRRVEQPAARYNARGPQALGDQRRHNGRKPQLLTQAVLAALAERLRAPPEDGGLCSGPKAAAWMAAHLGLEKGHPQRGWEALKRIGWSVQTPRPRHPRGATPDQQAAFQKTR